MFNRLTRRRAEAGREAFGLEELSPGDDPVLDIVAIHGLNGHRERTWTAENGVNWLKDLLPQRRPDARIFSFGYDARISTTRGFISQQNIHDHSTALLTELSLKRRATETYRRPIIFIAHSLGGIICKGALILASAASESHLKAHKDIHISTYGILFFGTPHQGGNGVSIGKCLVNVASAVGASTNKKLLKHMEMHSDFLQQQTDHYKAISTQFETKFFYETLETSTPVKSIQIVPKYSAVIPGTVNTEEIAINRNHKEMVRFPSDQDDGFQKTHLTLELMVSKAVSRINTNWQRYDTQNHSGLNEAFHSPDQRVLDIAFHGAPTMGTVEIPRQRDIPTRGYILDGNIAYTQAANVGHRLFDSDSGRVTSERGDIPGTF